MTYEKSNALNKARMSFVQQIIDEIDNVPYNSTFSRSIFYVISKFGLQLLAKKEGLFTYDNQINPELSQIEFKLRLKKFLLKNIK